MEDDLNSVWTRLAEFCDHRYREFIPRSVEKQQLLKADAEIQERCARLLFQDGDEVLGKLIEKAFPSGDARKRALDFLRSTLSENPRGRPPAARADRAVEEKRTGELTLRYRSDAKRLAELMERGLAEQRDLVSLDSIADLLKRYQQARSTYLLLYAVLATLPAEGRETLTRSPGFGEILRWGANPYLREFWFRYQQHVGATRVAIKTEAAQNLARELGETEDAMRLEVERLRARTADLETEVARLRAEGETAALLALGRHLQSRPNPVLDHLVETLDRLRARSETEEFGLSGDLLSSLIILEEILEGLGSLGLRHFPSDPGTPFTLSGGDLGRFHYVRGTPFRDAGDTRLVRCLRRGWEAGELLIAPARVEELDAPPPAETKEVTR